MKILSIYPGHCATVAYLKNGEITDCISEEKFDNIKNSMSFPVKSIEWILQKNSLDINDFDKFAIVGTTTVFYGINIASNNVISFMLQKEGFENSMKLIDTLRVSRHLLEDSPKHQLQYFRYQMGIYRYEEMEAKSLNIEIKAHDAIGDVLVLKLFLSKLKELIVEKYKGENPVEKMVELTKQPILIKKFKFGKYKDKTIQEVAQSDPNYLGWMLSSMDNLDDDLRYSIEYYLASPEKTQ